MMKKIIPVILSGGFGTRLWPISREKMPKQFNDEISSPTLFQKTKLLVNDEIFAKPIIISNHSHKFLIQNEEDYEAIVLEPSSRNTAPAILAVSLFVKKHYGCNCTLLVLPSDHIITNKDLFLQSVKNGLAAVEENIVLLGVQPTHPETGYGYIQVEDFHRNVTKVVKFCEKPSKSTAEEFIANGNFYWNAGIFLFNSNIMIDLCEKFENEMLFSIEKSITDAEITRNIYELSQDFSNAKSISVDYAILEKSSNIYLSKMLSSWSDVGSFASLYAFLPKDENNNVIRGSVQVQNTTGCFIQNTTQSIATVYGMQNAIIIYTKDSTLVMPMSCSQNVKQVVENLVDIEKKIEFPVAQRPWGTYEVLHSENGAKVKKIIVEPQKSLSLQSHNKRAENWVVTKGIATVTRGNDVMELTVGQSIFIPLNTKHRLQNFTSTAIEIIEVQTGSYLEEDDIIRYQDNWGRC